MRVKIEMITEGNFMFCLAGQLYDQAPNRQPRKANEILLKARELFREKAYNDNEYYIWTAPKDTMETEIKEMLLSIEEFKELNLSQIEYDKGVKVSDEHRPHFGFTSAYDVYDSESWKSDFVDLDAFIRNFIHELVCKINYERECSCCAFKYDNVEKEEKCNTCLYNPNLQNNYESDRTPRGEHKFACRYDCHRGYYICCEECDSKEGCDYICDDKSKTCGNAINHV